MDSKVSVATPLALLTKGDLSGSLDESVCLFLSRRRWRSSLRSIISLLGSRAVSFCRDAAGAPH